MKAISFYGIEPIGENRVEAEIEGANAAQHELCGLRFQSISILSKPRKPASEIHASKSNIVDPLANLDEVFHRTIKELENSPIVTPTISDFYGENSEKQSKNLPRRNLKTEKSFSPLVSISATDGEAALPQAALPRIFVVEDDDVISGFLVHLLQQKGFSVKLATDGRQVVEMFGRIAPPDLIILDVMLPFLNGFELIERIRATKHWNHVPIIMLTAKTNEADIARALESGADDYMSKPFQSQELLARVNRFVKL